MHSLDELSRESKNEINRLNETITYLRSSLGEKDEALQEKEQILHDLNQKISEIEKIQINSLSSQNKAEELFEKLQHLTLEHSVTLEENKNILEENEELFRRLRATEERINSISYSNHSDQNQLDEINGEVESLKQQLERTKNLLSEKDQQLEKLSSELQYTVSNQNTSSSILADKVEELELRITELVQAKESYEIEIENKNEIIAELKLKEVNVIDENHDNDISENYKSEIEKLSIELQELSKSKESVEFLINEKNSIIEEQGKRLSQIKLQKTDKEIEFIKLKEQLEDFKNQVEKLNESKNHYKVQASKKSEELDMISKRLALINNQSLERESIEESQKSIINSQIVKIDELKNKIALLETYNKATGSNLSKEETPAEDFNKLEEEITLESDDYETLSEDSFGKSNDENDEKVAFSFANSLENVGVDPFSKNDSEFYEEKQEEPVSEYTPIKESANKFAGELTSFNDNLPKHTQFSHLFYGDVSVVTVNLPRATMDIASIFKEYLNALIENKNSKIVIDLSECEFVDSTVLGVLVSSLKKAMSIDGDLRIVWGDNTESSMFYITRMDKVFKLFDSLENAIQSYLL